MTTTLYFGNLPWATTEADLVRAVSAYAHVHSARIVTDRETGRSRGFGFVEVDDADAARVVESLNGSLLGGRPLTVAVAQNQRR